ncbi:tetratricopeptide repeat protein [Micromonospora sp. NPDC023814]|uniref:tetratricopeptide repeat protein n=1 Tax=Micromonospora sp. NPDC023814 TaxID=3154596 RepID=UPI0033D51361
MSTDEPIHDHERAEWLVDHGRVDEAVALARARVADEPYLGNLAWLADMLADNGRFDEAVAEWRRAIAGGVVGARGGLAALLARAGRIDEATAAFRAAVAEDEPSAQADLARHLARTGHAEEAEGIHRALVSAGDHAVVPDLVKLLAETGRRDDAVAVSRSVRHAGDVPLYPVGRVFEEHGLPDEAIGIYRAALAAGGTYLYGRLARLLYQQGRLDETIQVLRDATDDLDQRADAWRALGRLLVIEGRDEEFEAEAKRCAAVEDGFFLMHFAGGASRGRRHLAGTCGCARTPD